MKYKASKNSNKNLAQEKCFRKDSNIRMNLQNLKPYGYLEILFGMV